MSNITYNPSYSGVLVCGVTNYTVNVSDYQMIKNVYECGQNQGEYEHVLVNGSPGVIKPTLFKILLMLLFAASVLCGETTSNEETEHLTISSLNSSVAVDIFNVAFESCAGINVNDSNTYIKVIRPDMQKKQCEYVTTGTDIVAFCDPWGKYYRANAPPIHGDFNKGCSVGSSNTQC